MKTTESLKMIQQELKAPKGQFNSFGKYKYRSAEDILEAVKPLLAKYDCVLTVSDELVNLGARYYIKASASLIHVEDNSTCIVHGYAREEETKKGMDGSQITGASSSYARKYALNGLFAIDDTKDSDATNNHDKEEKKANDSILNKINTAKTVKELGVIWSGLTEEEQPVYLDKFTVRKAILEAK